MVSVLQQSPFIPNQQNLLGGNTGQFMGPQQFPNKSQFQPSIGLAGFEAAQQAGLGAGLSSLEQGQAQARVDLLGGGQGAIGAIQTGQAQGVDALRGANQNANQLLAAGSQDASNLFNQGVGGLNQSLQDLIAQSQLAQEQIGQSRNAALGQLSGGLGNINQSQTQGLDLLRTSREGGVAALDPFASGGLNANQEALAFSGALGPQAEAEARARFSESPAQKFSRERQEQSLLRNQSALGGLQGGAVMQELQRLAAGNAAQQDQQRFANLQGLGQQGQAAASNIANLFGQEGQSGANLINALSGQRSNLASAGANIESQAGQSLANLLQQTGLSGVDVGQSVLSASGIESQNQAGFAKAASELATELGIGEAEIVTSGAGKVADINLNTGTKLASLSESTGLNAADLFQSSGTKIADARFKAGTALANSIESTTSALSDLQAGEGAGLSDLLEAQGVNLGNLTTSEVQVLNGLSQAEATLLANIATGAGTNMAQLQQDIGIAQSKGLLGAKGATVGTLTKIAMAFPSGPKI